MRRICVFTGSRAEYGIFKPLLDELAEAPDVDLRLLVSGTHLSEEHGRTIGEILRDGFEPDETVEILVPGDSRLSVAQSLGLATTRIAEALDRMQPDILVLLGDRYETLAAASAASILNIPIAHLHGGELTEGSVDDALRHAVTKLSQLHFPAAEEFGRRIRQMGEQPERIHVVGALGVDNALNTERTPRKELAASLGIELSDPLVTVTYHPATLLAREAQDAELAAVLEALEAVEEDTTLVITGSNADARGQEVTARLEELAAKAPRAVAVPSLGRVGYLSLLAESDALLGNSSSGIIEAPALGVPTVNVGDRQAGRPRAASIVDVPGDAARIEAALREAISRGRAVPGELPYGGGGAAGRISAVLREVELDGLLRKRFADL